MNILHIFPAMEILFIQNQIQRSIYSYRAARMKSIRQMVADQSKKRYLLDSFEKMQKLKALALVPLSGKFEPDVTREFLGPSNFLQLTTLPELTSISALITLFASPDGETTGLLTVSPTKVLPPRLESLHIIVDHQSLFSLVGPTPLNEACFQPRDAALQFLNELASICSIAFPALRQVEYIWAVDRTDEDQEEPILLEQRAPRYPGDPESARWRRSCDGSVPLCCDMHTRIQALSPDEDYTSRAESIVSPFKQRFDDLEALFKEVNVAFKVTELKSYSDYFHHWRGTQE